MKTDTISALTSFYAAEINRYTLAAHLLGTMGERLTDSASFAPSYYFQVTVDNREDLALLMTLAPRWDKHAADNGVSYNAEVNGERFEIVAKSAAIPPTCRMVEEEFEIPAEEAKPSRVGKRMVLKCEQGAESVPVESDVPFAVEVSP